MTRADERRRLGVRANADPPEDAQRARVPRQGDRAVPHRAHVPRGSPEDRRAGDCADRRRARPRPGRTSTASTAGLHRDPRGDGRYPVTIRLLDLPLHEFLPDYTELSVQVAVGEATGEPGEAAALRCPRCSGCTSRTRCSGCAGSARARRAGTARSRCGHRRSGATLLKRG